MQQLTTEERLAALERDMAELKQARRDQDTINGALLARIDSFIGDMHRVERDQKRGFDELKAGQMELASRLGNVETDVATLKEDVSGLKEDVAGLTKGMGTLVEIARDHRQVIETLGGRMNRLEEGQQALQAGMDQVVAILTGKTKTND